MVTLLLSLRDVARAHATLVSSEPAADSRLAGSPRRVRLVFSEPIEAALGQISIIAADGRSMMLAPRADARDVHALVAPIDTLPAGAYRVTWRIVSADGHPVSGSFVFYVGSSGEGRGAPPPMPALATSRSALWGPGVAGAPLIPAVLRGLAVGCLMALDGLLFFLSARVAGPAPRPARIALWLAVATPVMLGAHLLAWLVNVSPEHRLSTDAVSSALGTTQGRVELWRTGFALLALWALVLARRPRLAFVFALVALVVSGAAGHPTAIHPLWAVPSKALHLVAASAWLGGLLWLVVQDWDDLAIFAAEARRVSSVALAAVVAVAVSGVVQVVLFLHSPGDLVRSAYGMLTLAKVAGLAALVAFGARHRFRVLPRLEAGGMPAALRSSVAREVAVMGVVVLLGGFLAYVPPPAVARHSPASHGSPQ